MIKCKEFIHTVSHDIDGSWKKRWGMWMHYYLCIHCRRYVEQLKVIATRIKEFYLIKTKEDHSETIKKIEDKVLTDLFKN